MNSIMHKTIFTFSKKEKMLHKKKKHVTLHMLDQRNHSLVQRSLIPFCYNFVIDSIVKFNYQQLDCNRWFKKDINQSNTKSQLMLK